MPGARNNPAFPPFVDIERATRIAQERGVKAATDALAASQITDKQRHGAVAPPKPKADLTKSKIFNDDLRARVEAGACLCNVEVLGIPKILVDVALGIARRVPQATWVLRASYRLYEEIRLGDARI